MRHRAGREPAGVLPDESAPGQEETLQHQPLHPQPGRDGLPVRADPAVLGGGHGSGLQLAVWKCHVQDHPLRDGDEHVRQRVFPHRHERHPLLVGGLGAEGPDPAAGVPGALGDRRALGLRHGGIFAHRYFLHGEERGRREAVPAGLPGWPVVAGAVPPPEDPGGLCVPHADCHRVLPAAAALRPPAQHEQQPGEAEVQGDPLGHHRRPLLLHLLDAQPRHHLLGRPGEIQRGQLG